MPKRITGSNAKPTKEHSKNKPCACGHHSSHAQKPKRKDLHNDKPTW